MTIQTILDAGVSKEWLACELFRRAAFHLEKCDKMQDAAECWAEAGENARAAEIYLQANDQAKAAPLLLAQGRHAQALACYQGWLNHIAEDAVETRVTAMLGISACLKLMKKDRLTAREMYRRARRFIEDGNGRAANSSAKCWEALGAYGTVLARNDLIYVGYEKALACYEASHYDQRLKTARKYLKAVSENRLLAADIENRIAEWSSKEESPPLPPVLLRREPMTVS